jgi:hypothetical protein
MIPVPLSPLGRQMRWWREAAEQQISRHRKHRENKPLRGCQTGNNRTRLAPIFRSSYTISATTFHELGKAMGAGKPYDSGAAPRFEVPGFMSPYAVQGLKIGGASARNGLPITVCSTLLR